MTFSDSINCFSGLRRSSEGVKPDLSNPMTTANCPGNEELDFRLIFGEDGQQQPLGPAGLCFPTFALLPNLISPKLLYNSPSS